MADTADIFDRRTGKYYRERQYGGNALRFLYENVLGRLLLKLFVTGKPFSAINARRESSRRSVRKIEPFIRQYGIDMKDYEQRDYLSFADFFRRSVKSGARPVCGDENSLVSVADSKLTAYKISSDLVLKIKNSVYTIEELLSDNALAEEYRGGVCLVFRLTVDDYHHFCYPAAGTLSQYRQINGVLHTVSPISTERYKVYCENQREFSVLNTVRFGKVVQMEIGALLVGKIKNLGCEEFAKGQEKGWFELGGSTVVLLLKENAVAIDDDILAQSAAGFETKVRYGEKIGVDLCL